MIWHKALDIRALGPYIERGFRNLRGVSWKSSVCGSWWQENKKNMDITWRTRLSKLIMKCY